MRALDWIAERRLEQAVAEGLLDDLPGKGRPVEVDLMENVPAELRMGYTVLRAAGLVPDEIEVRRSLLTLEDLIAQCEDPERRTVLIQERARLRLAELELDASRDRSRDRRISP